MEHHGSIKASIAWGGGGEHHGVVVGRGASQSFKYGEQEALRKGEAGSVMEQLKAESSCRQGTVAGWWRQQCRAL